MKKNYLAIATALTIFAAQNSVAQTDSSGSMSNTSTNSTMGTYNSGANPGLGVSRFSWGIRAGVNFTNINGKYNNGDKMKNKLLTGWHAGINAEIPVAPDFYIQPGVLFTTAGAKIDNDYLNQTYNTTVHLSYIEVPVNFVYKPLVGAGHIILGVGPYVDFGIAGKVKYSGTGAPANRDIKFQNSVSASDNANNAYYRSFGAGGNLLFGYEFANRLSLQLNAQLGMTDINPDYGNLTTNNVDKATKTSFGISAGYRF